MSTSPKLLARIGSRIAYYDLSGEYAFIRKGTIKGLSIAGIEVVEDDGRPQLVPQALVYRFEDTGDKP